MQFLLAFFQSYREYYQNEFFISGESYAGIYVPYLANAIDTFNSYNPDDKLNFKGFAVGNGCTDPLECQLKYNTDPFQAQTFYDQVTIPL